MTENPIDLADRQLPAYLFPKDREQLLKLIQEFPHERNFYSVENDRPDPIQGDGWTSFVVFDFISGAKKEVPGIILSNSCDVVQGNAQHSNARVVFVPIIRLQRLVEVMREAGAPPKRIEDTLGRLRKQHVFYVLYLPAYGDMEESVALLDDVHSLPLSYLYAATKKRIFRLGQFGHWFFLLKLSIHFTRFQEDIRRGVGDDSDANQQSRIPAGSPAGPASEPSENTPSAPANDSSNSAAQKSSLVSWISELVRRLTVFRGSKRR